MSAQSSQPSQGSPAPQAARSQPYLSKYHVREQTAYALLGPLHAQLAELERRAGHYTARVNMEDVEAQPIRAAEQAIAHARQEVERLWQESGARYGR